MVTGTATSASVISQLLSSQSAHANSLSSQVLVLVWTKDTVKRHWYYNKTSYPQSQTLHTHKSANPTAAHVRKRTTPHTKMRPRTEPSLSKDPSQFSRPLERSKLDKQEKTARVSQRKRLSAKPTTTKVDSVPNKTALPSQPAHHNSALEALKVVLVSINEQYERS